MSTNTFQKQSFWQQSVNFLATKREKWGLILFLALYIPLFLLIFQPFGVNNYDPTHSIRWEFFIAAIGFGLVNGVSMWLYEFVIAPRLFTKRTRAIFIIRMVLELLLLSFTTYLFYNVLGNFHDWNWPSFFGFVRDVGLSGLIPLGLVFLYFNYKRTRSSYEALLNKSKFNRRRHDLVRITSDNGKENLVIASKGLLFIEAQDNYVAVYHIENDRVKKSLLRTTMKRLENLLTDQSIVRCHRSYMVNMGKVEKVSGPTHQLKIHLEHIEKPIPVSKTYVPVLEEGLTAHHS